MFFFLINQGHTGDIGATQADLVLPGAAFTEKQGTYANMEGRAQQTLAAITPPSLARVDWQIVRAMSELSNHTLQYDNLIQLRSRMAQMSPSLVQYNKNVLSAAQKPPAGKNEPPKVVSNLKLTPLLNELADFYQTDAISRASSTMAKCVQAVSKEINKRQIRDDKVAQKA